MDAFKRDFTTGYVSKDNKLGMSPAQVALIVAMLSAGTAVGALLSAPMGDFWGRRTSLIVAISIFCIGAILQVCASRIPLLVIGRYEQEPSGVCPGCALFVADFVSYLGRWLVLVLGLFPFWSRYTSLKWHPGGFVVH